MFHLSAIFVRDFRELWSPPVFDLRNISTVFKIWRNVPETLNENRFLGMIQRIRRPAQLIFAIDARSSPTPFPSVPLILNLLIVFVSNEPFLRKKHVTFGSGSVYHRKLFSPVRDLVLPFSSLRLRVRK